MAFSYPQITQGRCHSVTTPGLSLQGRLVGGLRNLVILYARQMLDNVFARGEMSAGFPVARQRCVSLLMREPLPESEKGGSHGCSG